MYGFGKTIAETTVIKQNKNNFFIKTLFQQIKSDKKTN